MAEGTVRGKMSQNARHFRLVSRADAFQQKRKTYDQLDYLKYYSPPLRENILFSMQTPIPTSLPPLTLITISFYRRKSLPVFVTRSEESMELEGHMTYESLWILSSLEQKMFEDYQSVVKQFERDLGLYLSANSNDIREMAVIAAGNKIIGKQSDILGIVESDNRQLWVLANHIYQSKIPFQRLFPFLTNEHEMAFKTLFELTMLMENEVKQAIMAEEAVVKRILMAMNAQNDTIRKYAIRIVGNVVAMKEENIGIFHKYGILDYLQANLNSSNGDIRKDVCWLISNLCTKKGLATVVLQNSVVITKLVDLFAYEAILAIKRELTYIFCYLAHFGDQKQAFLLLGHPNVLEICYNQLCVEDEDLNMVTLLLIKELMELGDHFKNEQEKNIIVQLLRQSRTLSNEISKKSFSDNDDVNGISIEIMNLLEEDEDKDGF